MLTPDNMLVLIEPRNSYPPTYLLRTPKERHSQ